MTHNQPIKKILLVDDEQDLLEILSFNIEGKNYHVETATSALEALEKNINSFDLILLDVMMQGMSGFQFAEEIRRKRGCNTPIIFLTAKDTENDLLTGFSLGADDYISKPFSIKEVMARIQAVLNRTSNDTHFAESNTIAIADVVIDLPSKTVKANGEVVKLAKKEFEILQLLAEKPNYVFPRTTILDRIWKGEYDGGDRTVDVHITRLRKKLQNAHVQIVNRSGFGYSIVEKNIDE